MTEGGGGKNFQNIDYVICERPLRIELLMIEFFRKSRYPVVAVHSGASRRQRTTPSPSMDRQRTRIQNH